MYQPTSLNLIVRKKETERIERENHAFAKRLFDRQAVVNKKNLDKDYIQHLKYKRQIAKMPAGSKGMGRPRAQTRGANGTGMSHQHLGTDGFPQGPSHYLGQPQPMMMSETEIQALQHAGMEPSDSVNLAVQQQHEMQQQPALSQEVLASSEIRAAAPEEEEKNQATAGAGAAQAQPDAANNNNEQQVTK